MIARFLALVSSFLLIYSLVGFVFMCTVQNLCTVILVLHHNTRVKEKQKITGKGQVNPVYRHLWTGSGSMSVKDIQLTYFISFLSTPLTTKCNTVPPREYWGIKSKRVIRNPFKVSVWRIAQCLLDLKDWLKLVFLRQKWSWASFEKMFFKN